MSDQYGAPGRVLREAAPARPKRFYAVAQVEEREGLFALLLDGRSARTPGKRILALPSLASAERVAAEWNAQVDTIDPLAMPLTRIANSAIDGVAEQMQAVADEVRTYLTSDLVVYRAAAPAVLVEAEAVAWDPVLDWVRDTFHVRFILAEGLAFVQQPASTLGTLGKAIDTIVGTGPAAPFRLAATHVITTLTGSALIALAVMQGRLSPEDAWSAAHVDETFQESRWGADAEASARREKRWSEMRAAAAMGLLAGRAAPLSPSS